MEGQIKTRWDSLEQRRIAMVQRVRDLPPDRQTSHSDASSFSPVELIMHMALSDQVTVDRIKKNPPSSMTKTSPKATLMFKIVVSGMNAGRRMPAPPNMKPEGEVSLEDAAKKWESVRRELATFLEMAPSPDTVIQRSFLFGRLSAADVLDLMASHQNYHERYFPAS